MPENYSLTGKVTANEFLSMPNAEDTCLPKFKTSTQRFGLLPMVSSLRRRRDKRAPRFHQDGGEETIESIEWSPISLLSSTKV
jgi:hypothetical protein